MNNINQENIENHLTYIVLSLLQEDVVFQKSLAEFAPSIQDKINSYKDNPNCTCRNDISAYCMSNQEAVVKFLLDFVKDNPQVHGSINKIIEENPGIYVGGKVFEIENTKEAYKDFVNKTFSSKYQFRAFTAIEKDKKLLIYFI